MSLIEMHLLTLAGAMLLECLWVEMRGVPHIVCGIGNYLSVLERWFYKKSKARGFFVVFLILFSVGSTVLIVIWLIAGKASLFIPVGVIVCGQILAGSLLIRTGRQVFQFLEAGDLDGARERLTWLVGRDTQELDEQQVKKAALESMAENLSDGMIAPMFYFAVAGVPGILIYKVINTLDSRFGYKNEKYSEFGYCSAKLDDLASYIPARITALLMVLCSPKQTIRGLSFVRRYGRCHLSPNAGYPESALAGILNCRFGGSHLYGGVVVEKDWIGEREKVFTQEDVAVTSKVSQRASWVFFGLIVVIGLILDLFIRIV